MPVSLVIFLIGEFLKAKRIFCFIKARNMFTKLLIIFDGFTNKIFKILCFDCSISDVYLISTIRCVLHKEIYIVECALLCVWNLVKSKLVHSLELY